jgi:hypothetical protein
MSFFLESAAELGSEWRKFGASAPKGQPNGRFRGVPGSSGSGLGDRDTKQKALQINDLQGLCYSGGRCRVRTCDPCRVKAVLYR